MSAPVREEQVQLMNRARILRMVKRMAFQILEDHKDQAEIIVYGIDQRGYNTARMLTAELKKNSSQPIQLARLSVRNDGDVQNMPKTSSAYVLLVDDVLFSGQTMMKAISTLINTISFGHLRIAVMVDRGHRVLPVHADFTGMISPTKFNEHVAVSFDENGQAEQVLLYPSH